MAILLGRNKEGSFGNLTDLLEGALLFVASDGLQIPWTSSFCMGSILARVLVSCSVAPFLSLSASMRSLSGFVTFVILGSLESNPFLGSRL